MTLKFEYGTARVKDIQVTTKKDTDGKTSVTSVKLKGRNVKASGRFWNSLHTRFGFTSNIFKYFSHAEVFGRIAEVAPSDELRTCVENNDGERTLMAVANPTAGFIKHDDLMGLLEKSGVEGTTYANGVITSEHAPRLNPVFKVSGDGFQNKFVIDTPIDGYGRPAVYLSMMRLICANGAIGYSPTFRSELPLGKGENGVAFVLERVLDGFNNEEGYAALRQRFESASKSWASVNEATRLYKVLAKMLNTGQVAGIPAAAAGGDGASLMDGVPLLSSYHRMAGDLAGTYGLANMDTLSVKRQRTLPAGCKVYDLLNFASEVATHHATGQGARTLQAYIGDLISAEYDLEGTSEQFGDWKDFFVVSGGTAVKGAKRR